MFLKIFLKLKVIFFLNIQNNWKNRLSMLGVRYFCKFLLSQSVTLNWIEFDCEWMRLIGKTNKNKIEISGHKKVLQYRKYYLFVTYNKQSGECKLRTASVWKE